MTTLSDFSNAIAAAIAQVAPVVVALPAKRFSISGIHWQPGVIVTAIDAVRCKDDLTLMTAGGEAFAATVVGADPGTDLAVLRVEALDLPTPQFGDLDALQVGHLSLAVGRLEDGTLRASSGILASVGGEWQSWTGGHIDRLLRPDIRPFPSFAGSPLLDPEGRVLGMNTTYSRGRFAVTIPVPTINRVVHQLLQGGRVTQGYLGVGLQAIALPDHLKQALNLSQETAMLIVSVEAGSPAEQGGLLIGDILLTLSGAAIASVQALRSQLRFDRIGQPIGAQIIRAGGLVELTLTVGER